MPLTSEEAQQQAQAEGLTLRKADNKAGYYGVNHKSGESKPYEARLFRGGGQVYLATSPPPRRRRCASRGRRRGRRLRSELQRHRC